MARADMDSLLQEGLEIAMLFLERHGEFYPFGLTMNRAGEISHTQSFTGEEYPTSPEVIKLLLEGFTAGAKAGEYKATALVSDVQIDTSDKTTKNAISVAIEHLEEMPVTCFLPYQKRDDTYEFGEIFAESGEPEVFLPW